MFFFQSSRFRKMPDWEKFWNSDNIPWDQGDCTPAFKHAVTSGYFKGNVLIPGCGYGWDVLYLAKNSDCNVTGLDLSPSCIKKCVEKHGSSKNFKFVEGDFFAQAVNPAQVKYDSAFDYTFFCAIDIEMRPAWGKTYSNLIHSGGHLITLMFPLKEKVEVGPPHTVSLEEYQQALLDFTLVQRISDIESFPNRVGYEELAIWRRK
eukprot:NODE_359_length_10180_cov_0.431703.p6 type:complete len:205 gc:universal NODE_359_length_10180_cov_0.431703:432-1046(+)